MDIKKKVQNPSITIKEAEKKEPLDFDNCNVYIKEKEANQNRPNTRKRSAFKFIEDSLPTSTSGNALNKSNKEPSEKEFSSGGSLNIKSNFNSNNPIVQPGGGSFNYKIQSQSNNPLQVNNNEVKKPEYESRRKKNINNILNELDTGGVGQINQNEGKKNNNFNFSSSLGKNEMIVGNEPYKKLPSNSQSSSATGLFESRRHVQQTKNQNSFNMNLNSKPPTDKDKNKIFI
jgi:hypothetical protein